MKKISFKKLRDYDGDVKGYKLGDYYLVKHWGGAYTYTWIINKTGENVYWDREFWRLEEQGEIEICENYKQGKDRLVELYLQDVNYTGVNNKKEAV